MKAKGPTLTVGSQEIDLGEVVRQIKVRPWARRYVLSELLPHEIEIPINLRARLPWWLRWLPIPAKTSVRIGRNRLVILTERHIETEEE